MKKKWEVRYFVTAVASVPVYKAYSKTETYKQAAKPGWGTVEWYSAADGYKNPVDRDRKDKTQELVCDEDSYADLYTKNGGYFGIHPYDEINVKEMPKQAECAAIIHGDSCGFDFWAEDYSLIHIFVTYDENGLIDAYRIEYGADETTYDGEVEISFDDLYQRAEDDWKETYRAEIPGTLEYDNKREADKLAQEAGETWMNAEEREQFRRVCNKIGGIKSAWDFFCTMQLIQYDYDKKIIDAARKFKKCFNFAQYEQPQEVARREELLEEYKKYDFAPADTTDAAENSQQDKPGAEMLTGTAAEETGTGKPYAETRKEEGGGTGPPPQGKEKWG